MKYYFEGLPTPAAAVTMAMVVLACDKNGWADRSLSLFVLISLMALLSFLMVSKIRYPKLSSVQFSKWKPLFYLKSVLFLITLLYVNLESALTLVSLLFLFLAPVYGLPASSRSEEAMANKTIR